MTSDEINWMVTLSSSCRLFFMTCVLPFVHFNSWIFILWPFFINFWWSEFLPMMLRPLSLIKIIVSNYCKVLKTNLCLNFHATKANFCLLLLHFTLSNLDQFWLHMSSKKHLIADFPDFRIVVLSKLSSC